MIKQVESKQAGSKQAMSKQVKQYLVITGNYWAFTLTDGVCWLCCTFTS